MDPKSIETFVSFGLPVLILIAIIVAWRTAGKKEMEVLQKLCVYVKGKASRTLFMPTFAGEYEGTGFFISLISAGKNSPPYLVISLNKASSFWLKIYKESVLIELGKKLGLARDVKTYDEAFDAEFFISSDKPNQAQSHLSDPAAKAAVRGLFQRGFNGFVSDGKTVTVSKPHYSLAADLEPQNVLAVLSQLSAAAQGL